MVDVEQAPDDADAKPLDDPDALKKDALSSLDRRIKLSDLKSTGAQKLVLDRLDKAEDKIKKLESVEDDYHELKVSNAKTEAKVEKLEELDWVQSFLLGAGFLIIGLAPSLPSDRNAAIGAFFVGLVLVLAYLASKLRAR